jgi:hypothetical protein
MISWPTKQKKNKEEPNIVVSIEGNSIVILASLTKQEAIDIRENLRNDYRNIPKLNKKTFEEFVDSFLTSSFEEAFDDALQKYADEGEESSSFESW